MIELGLFMLVNVVFTGTLILMIKTKSLQLKGVLPWLFIVAYGVGLHVIWWRVFRDHTASALSSRCQEFYAARAEGDFATAYDFMSPQYRDRTPFSDYVVDPGFADVFQSDVYPEVRLFGRAAVYQRKPEAFQFYSGSVHYWQRRNGVWFFTGEWDHFLD